MNEEGGGEVAADRADDHEHEHADPDLVPGGQGPDVAHDELRPLGAVTERARVSAAVATIRPPALATMTVAGCFGSAVGTKAALRSRWRTAWAASATVAPADVEGRAGGLLEAGAQRRGLCGRPDDADLDVVRMGLVVGADDAESRT